MKKRSAMSKASDKIPDEAAIVSPLPILRATRPGRISYDDMEDAKCPSVLFVLQKLLSNRHLHYGVSTSTYVL